MRQTGAQSVVLGQSLYITSACYFVRLMHVSAVDLFCGAGGLTNGLEQAGITVEAGFDIDPDCAYPYEVNNDAEFYEEDVGEIARDEPDRIGKLLDDDADATLIAGCAPCQPFSPLTHGEDSSDHDQYGMLRAFLEIVRTVDPDLVVMENVYEIRDADVYEEFVEGLVELGYNLNLDDDKRVYCPDYGIPQTRRRWVVLGSKRGMLDLGEPHISDPEEYVTVEKRIKNIPPLEAGERHESDPLHWARDLSDKNRRRVAASEPGKTWEDWPKDLLLECHKKESGQTYGSVYGRMVPDEPAPTITTQFYNLGSGRFGHYDTDQNRALSLREGAMIQTFPREYRFAEDPTELGMLKIGRLIGNAVPPELGRLIGERILEFLEGTDRQIALTDY